MSIRFKLSPELVDGDHWTVCNTLPQVFEAIQAWYDAGQNEMVGEGFQIEMVEMSDAEVEALPEI
jgi:hypothetical protein